MTNQEKKLFKEFEAMIDKKIKDKIVSIRITKNNDEWIKKNKLKYAHIFHVGLELTKRNK